jgi:hypothetical protein
MGLFDVGASLLDFGLNAWQEENKMDWQEQQAQVSRDWQERMANTQYQRTVQDLNAAGLSPMLAYSKGASSLPSGATATGGGAAVSNIAGGVQRSTERELMNQQIETAKSQELVNVASAGKIAAETANVNQDTENKKLYPGMNEAQIKELIERAGQHGASAGQLRALMDEVRQTINLRKPEESFKTENPTYSKYASPVMDALKTIFGGVGLLRGTSALPNTTKFIPKGGK